MKICIKSNYQMDWNDMEDAINPSTSSTRLKELANHHSDVIRTHVASNPNTPKAVRSRLMKDKLVVYGLKVKEANNPNTSPQRLAELALDPDDNIRSTVAMNPATPAKVLKQLTSDPSENVRSGLLFNPNAPTYMKFKHKR